MPSIRLYFPPDFGFDARIGAFPSPAAAMPQAQLTTSSKHDAAFLASPFAVPEWVARETHASLAMRVLQQHQEKSTATPPHRIRICRIHTGLFLHDGIGPWTGFHTARGVYSVVGDAKAGGWTAYTDVGDVARVIAVLSKRVLRHDGREGEVRGGRDDSAEIPGAIRLAGCVANAAEIARVMSDAGADNITLRSVDLDAYKGRLLGKAYEDRAPMPFVKLITGMGLGDYRPKAWGNDNEVVNPDQRLWRWKTVSDLARETGGRPNASV